MGWAYADPLPVISPGGERLVDALLLNDAEGFYSGGHTVFNWGAGHTASVTAQNYFTAYQANQIAADEKYQNETVIISGTIASINNDQLNGPYISFAVDGIGDSVYAFLDPSAIAEAASYQSGQSITLYCSSSGVIMDIPQLKQCYGQKAFTVKLTQNIHDAVEQWLTGGRFPYGNKQKIEMFLLLIYEGGKTLNAPDSAVPQIIDDPKRILQIIKAGAVNPDIESDAPYLGLPLNWLWILRATKHRHNG
jgi:hypothetical protein